MNSMNQQQDRDNIAANLSHLRARHHLSQEEVAEKIGVTRQAVAKWENGDSLPDILNCERLADLFDVSLNDLVRFDPAQEGMAIPPKNKYIFGTVTIGERGQLVLPKKARDALNLQPGDTLVVLGDTNPGTAGIALIGSQTFLRMTGQAIDGFFGGE
jgi:AbrB family looped-hinge helix DNA binding protein